MELGRYRHRSAGDVDVIITNVKEEKDNCFVVNVIYILRTTGRALDDETDTVTIMKKHLGNWTRIY